MIKLLKTNSYKSVVIAIRKFGTIDILKNIAVNTADLHKNTRTKKSINSCKYYLCLTPSKYGRSDGTILWGYRKTQNYVDNILPPKLEPTTNYKYRILNKSLRICDLNCQNTEYTKIPSYGENTHKSACIDNFFFLQTYPLQTLENTFETIL